MCLRNANKSPRAEEIPFLPEEVSPKVNETPALPAENLLFRSLHKNVLGAGEFPEQLTLPRGEGGGLTARIWLRLGFQGGLGCQAILAQRQPLGV